MNQNIDKICVENEELYNTILSSNNTKNISHAIVDDYSHKYSLTKNTKYNKQAEKQVHKQQKIEKFHSELEKWRIQDFKHIKQMLEYRKSKKEIQFHQQLHMNKNSSIYNEVNCTLAEYNKHLNEKKILLHHKWNTNVFLPIVNQIETHKKYNKDFLKYKKLKMQALYDKYLHQCKKNGDNIFLDSINEEYNPFEWYEYENKIQMKNIHTNDPLKADLYKYMNEQKLRLSAEQFINNKTMINGNIEDYRSKSNTISIRNTSRTLNSSTSNRTHMRRNRIAHNWSSTQTGIQSGFSYTPHTSISSTTMRNHSCCVDNNDHKIFSLKPRMRNCMDPRQYNAIHHLPYIKDMKILEDKRGLHHLPSHVPGGNVLLNQFEIPEYDANVIKKQYFPQSKRIVRMSPEFSKYEFKVSEMW